MLFVSFLRHSHSHFPEGNLVLRIYQRSGAASALPKVNVVTLFIYSYIHRFKTGAGGTILHSPCYVRKQSTPTTKTVAHTLASTSSTPKYYTFLRAQLDLDVLQPARTYDIFFVKPSSNRHVPSEDQSCICLCIGVVGTWQQAHTISSKPFVQIMTNQSKGSGQLLV